MLYPTDCQDHTDDCKDFILKLLCKTPAYRLTADEALKHKWILEPGSTTNLMTSCSSYIQSLRAYNGGNKLQHILFNAILNELSDEQQEILDQGLIGMQRELSRCTTNNVMDYMLLNTWTQDLPVRDEQWKKQRVNQLIKHQSTRSALHSNFLSPDAFTVISPRSTKKSSQNVQIRKSFVSRTDMFDSQLLDAMERLESLRSFGPEENTDQYIAYIDGALGRAMDHTKQRSPSPVTPVASLPNIESAMDIVCSPLSASSSLNDDIYLDTRHKCSASSDDIHLRKATSDEIEQRRISEARFRGIMSKAAIKYDIEEIIENLKDSTGHIPLNQIPLYTKTLKCLDDEKVNGFL